MADYYHKAYCLQFDAVGQPSPTNLKVQSRSWRNQPTLDTEVTSGNVSPDFVSFISRKVLGELSTYQLKESLDILGAMGFCIKSDATPKAGVVYYEQRYDKCGSPEAGSVHRSLTTSYGRAVPDNITVDHQGNAMLAFRVIPIKKDDATDILIVADDAALPTITIAPARWTLGPLAIAGVTLKDYTSYRINFGNEVDGRSTESDIDDTFVDHATHSPTIEVRGIDPTWFPSSIPIGGKKAAHADTSVYLRKRLDDETNFVPDETAEHIKFTIAGMGAPDDIASGGEVMRPTETSLLITGAVDSAGNAPLIIDTAAAIT